MISLSWDYPCTGTSTPAVDLWGGLYTGLSLCSGQWGFLAACDMPFLNGAIVEYLISLRGEADVIIPRLPGGLEPLHALYAKECLPYIRDLLASGDLKIIDFLRKVNCTRSLRGRTLSLRSRIQIHYECEYSEGSGTSTTNCPRN